jgi:hypothetical protein
MDVGQSETFTCTASGGTGTLSYQWYLAGSAVSGQTGTTYAYAPGSAGSPVIYCRVTDQASTPNVVQSNTPSVTVSASPTVSVAPVGPFTMDVGQVQVFTATPSGGSGTLSYQWYLDGSAVGTNSASYSYTAVLGSHSVTCKVTDSASTPVTSPASNAVAITVSATLVAPTASASPATIYQGQTSSLTSTAVSTGTSPYTYQWLEKAPGGSYLTVGTNSASFSFATSGSTATGSWSFELQVTDSASTPVVVTSAPISVTVKATVMFVSAGTSYGGTGYPTPTYPSGLQANDLILLQVTVRDTYNTPTTPTGFTLLSGQPDSTGTGRQWIYYKFSTGAESGSLTVTIGGTSTKMAQMYDFRNVALSSFTTGSGFGTNSGTTISAQSVATSGNGELAVSFVFVTNNDAVSAFTGETNGNWVEPVAGTTTSSGSGGSIQIQTATMANGGTITGGLTTISPSASWGVRAFALIPNS